VRCPGRAGGTIEGKNEGTNGLLRTRTLATVVPHLIDRSHDMASTQASIDIPASADQVWNLVAGFNSLAQWLPMIQQSEAQEHGRLRHLTTVDGTVIVERLESYDNAARTYSYSITQGPFPVTDYLATLKVIEVDAGNSRVEWGGRFTPAGISDAEAVEIFDGVYQGGLQALRDNF